MEIHQQQATTRFETALGYVGPRSMVPCVYEDPGVFVRTEDGLTTPPGQELLQTLDSFLKK